MKSSNAELFAQLTKLTQGLEFPVSCSSHPIHPFIWEVETQGEFNIENLLKTTTPDFCDYIEGGKIMRNGDLEPYLELILSQAQKQSTKTLQNYQTLINLLQSQVINLELLKIRALYDPKDNFHIIIGITASGEWVGISGNIPADSEDCDQMGIDNAQQIKGSEYQPENEATVDLVDRLQQVLQDLEFFEPEIFGFYTDKGWTVRVGETREALIHSLLEAIGFARTFPVCKLFHESEYYGEEELLNARGYLVLDEFLSENLINLRTYMFGMTTSYSNFEVNEVQLVLVNQDIK